MECSYCNKEIKNELSMILINEDGDFVCNEQCKEKYIEERNNFFQYISNDEWYEKNYFKLLINNK